MVEQGCSADRGGEGDDLSTVLLELPVSVVKRADLTRLQPTRDAVEVESVLGQSQSGRLVIWKRLNSRYKYPMLRCIPRWWRRLGWPGSRCLVHRSVFGATD